MNNTRTEAIVLRRTNYGEADRILNFITPQNGKMTAIAKGVRKPKSKLAGGLELLAVSDVVVRQGRGDMGTVTSARLVKFFSNILHDLDRLQLASEIIKKINQVTETVAEPDFYYLLLNSLKFLNETSIDSNLVELWFRLKLKQLLGIGPNLHTSVDGEPLSADSSYEFDFIEMAFSPRLDGKFSSPHIKLLRLVSVQEPPFLSRISGVREALADCLWLLRNSDI